jgi:glycosyltransferase involved in cell wall biosynthesis
MAATALVIPAWNEPEAMRAILAELPSGSISRTIVVVPEADDPTVGVAREYCTEWIVQQQKGYGAACWTGAMAALDGGADVVVFLDGDYSDPPAAVPCLIAPILSGQADLVVGCRDLRAHPDALPMHARLGNRAVCWLIAVLVGHRFSDLPSFKAIRADALRQLDMQEMTYGWTVEMLVKAAREKLRIEEIAVHYRPRLGGTSKVGGNLRGSVGAARKLFACALAYSGWRPASMTGGQ